MTFQQMKYFLTVADCLSFTAAAEQLYMTQPALGRQITALERELNMLLFQRSTKGIRLTPAGVYLKLEWEKELERHNKCIEYASHISQGYTGTLKVGLLDGIDISDSLTNGISEYERKYSDIHLYLKRYSFKVLREMLSAGELDLIITYYMDIFQMKDVSYKNIQKFTPAFAIPIRNPLARREQLKASDLKNEEFLITGKDDASFGIERVVEACQRTGGFYPKLFLVETVGETILRLETGVRCALLNMEMEIAKSSKVRMLPIDDPENQDHYFSAVWLKHNKNKSLEHFIDIL